MTESTASCHGCARPYGAEHGFPDLVVPDSIWERISPTGGHGGLLCPSCICERLHKAGIESCPGEFKSGPLARTESVDVAKLWEQVWKLRDRVDELEAS